MKINCMSTQVEGSKAKVVMESGDYLSVTFRDLSGGERNVHISVQGKVMVLREEKTDSAMLVRYVDVHLQQGE